MSNIALTPNASGTGTFTIASPNSNTDRTLTLPDATGTVNISGLANEVPAGSAGAPAIYSTGDTNTGIFFPAADTIAFSAGGSESMRIDSSGNLLVGKTSANATGLTGFELLTASSSLFSTVNTAGAANNYHFYNMNATNNGFRFYVQVNGGIANFSANNINLSDERVKTDIAPLGSYWDKIKALEVVTYKYLDQSHEDNNIGVIAQQVESVAPEFVSNDGFGETPEDGVPLKSVYEADLHYATLKALQEAMARIETLETRLAALEAAQ